MTILYLYKDGSFDIVESIRSFGFVFKYFALSSFIGVILPVVIKIIAKNVSIKVIFKDVSENEKNN